MLRRLPQHMRGTRSRSASQMTYAGDDEGQVVARDRSIHLARLEPDVRRWRIRADDVAQGDRMRPFKLADGHKGCGGIALTLRDLTEGRTPAEGRGEGRAVAWLPSRPLPLQRHVPRHG